MFHEGVLDNVSNVVSEIKANETTRRDPRS
jgi:hypothetical protein